MTIKDEVNSWFKGTQTQCPGGFVEIPSAHLFREGLTKPRWAVYGLSIACYKLRSIVSVYKGILTHNMVQEYLDAHPEIRVKYKPDQSGDVGYYDVLALAEKERGLATGEIKEEE